MSQGATFEGLHSELRQLLSELDFDEATEAQREAIPVIASGAHTLLLAPTGYGKTESALIPILDEFLGARDEYARRKQAIPDGFKILYITPLRALNRDMLRRIERWAATLTMRVGVRHSDTTPAERRRQALNPPDILITTPETLQLLFTGHRLRAALTTVRWLVVDEIHELAATERGYQLAVGLERLEQLQVETRGGRAKSQRVPSGFQRVGLSATVGNPQAVAELLGGAGRLVRTVQVVVDKPIEIRVELPRPSAEDRAEAARITATPEQVAIVRRMADLVRQHKATLVFSNTRDGAELLGSRVALFDPELPMGVHHGSLAKEARIEAEEAYKDGAVRALICTSSLELGIDVGDTDLVVQNGSPRGVERMVQRVGRAGHRAHQTSRGVVLAVSGEDAAEAAVIARRAMQRQLEPIFVRPLPLGVLANQLIHMAIELPEVPTARALAILCRSAPFSTLDVDGLDATLRQLDMQGLIGVDWTARTYRRRGRSRTYAIDNVGMIPDEKTFRVVDSTRRAVVGSLDEDFVLSYVEPGARFIMRGRTWDVLEIQEDAVLVAQGQALGAIPSWTGQDLPVPLSVAQEVARMRNLVASGDEQSLRSEYPMDDSALSAFVEEVKRNLSKGLAVATPDQWVLESGDRVLVLNACLGTRANQTLGRVLEALLGQRMGAGVQMSSDAYRVVLESSERLRAELLEQTLRAIETESVDALLRVIVRNSTFLRYHLLHVARKFGAVARDLDPKRFSVRRFLDTYRDMPLYKEAVERVLWETMDVPGVRAALRELAAGRITIVHQGLSPLGLLGIETERKALSPAEEEPSILKALARRLDRTKILLTCVVCGRARATTVEAAPAKPECPACASIMVAPLHPNETVVARLVRKAERTEQEQRRVHRAAAAANLVGTYGKRAIVVLCGRGVGPETAGRILRRQHEDEPALLRDILAAEVHYAKTRRFWD